MAHIAPRSAFIALLLLSACKRTPSDDEALVALRRAAPALDSARVVERVWRDGPPWFSCAEIRAKLGGRVPATADGVAFLKSQVGNWRPLTTSGWAAMRDTVAGPVQEPGWCVLALDSARSGGEWQPFLADSFPAGGRRRGWMVPVGHSRLVVVSTDAAGRDSARVRYGVTVAPNASGTALAADADTVRHTALLRREGGQWRVLALSVPEK